MNVFFSYDLKQLHQFFTLMVGLFTLKLNTF